MSVEEMKKQIVEKVNVMEEKALQQVLSFLSESDEKHSSISTIKYINQIFKENDGLLKRLS